MDKELLNDRFIVTTKFTLEEMHEIASWSIWRHCEVYPNAYHPTVYLECDRLGCLPDITSPDEGLKTLYYRHGELLLKLEKAHEKILWAADGSGWIVQDWLHKAHERVGTHVNPE